MEMNDRSKLQTAVLIHRPTSRGRQSRPVNRTISQRSQSDYGDKRPATACWAPNLQVQGFGCLLQQRPSSGPPSAQRPASQPTPKTDRPTPPGLLLLTTLEGKPESQVLPALRSRAVAESVCSKMPIPCVSNIPLAETAPTNPRKTQVQFGSVPELHLYLPSSKCEEEEEEDTQERRTCAERPDPQESEVKSDGPDPLLLQPNSLRISADQAVPGPSTTTPPPPPPPPCTHNDIITLDMGPRDLRQPPDRLQ